MDETPWDADWRNYYLASENAAYDQFRNLILPIIGEDTFRAFDKTTVLDFACGYGRMADIFSLFCKKLICVDIREDAIEYCRNRFANHKTDCKFECVVNSLEGIAVPDNSVTLVYSWDAMVHFDAKMIQVYSGEFYRVMKKGACGFIHHSNYCGVCGPKNTTWNENPHYRASVSADQVKKILEKQKLEVVKQQLLTWGNEKDLDCITVFKKK